MIRKVFNLVMLAILLFSGYQIINYWVENNHNKTILSDVQTVYQQRKNEPHDANQLRPAFVELQKKNPDMIGWISIEGTEVDYPILQSLDNEYYLKHNYQSEVARAGSIFKDYRNQSEDEKNTIIYGHNMKDGSMFASINNYLNPDFYKEHPTFEYETETKSYTVEVFAAYETTTDFYYIETNFQEPGSFTTYLDSVKLKSTITTNIEVSENDQILTLSTCDSGLDYGKGRFVVQGKLVEKIL